MYTPLLNYWPLAAVMAVHSYLNSAAVVLSAIPAVFRTQYVSQLNHSTVDGAACGAALAIPNGLTL